MLCSICDESGEETLIHINSASKVHGMKVLDLRVGLGIWFGSLRRIWHSSPESKIL